MGWHAVRTGLSPFLRAMNSSSVSTIFTILLDGVGNGGMRQ